MNRMNIYRLHPGLDAFVINDVYLPYIDIIAGTEAEAIGNAYLLMHDFQAGPEGNSLNTLNFIELIGKN